MAKIDITEKVVSLAKRRGFVFQSSEIYGGLNGCWDYGPLGVEMLNNIKQSWWKEMTYRENVEGIDAAILMHPRVWEASGHVENFTDPMVDCKECKARFRIDHLFDSIPKKQLSIIKNIITESIDEVLSDEQFIDDTLDEGFKSFLIEMVNKHYDEKSPEKLTNIIESAYENKATVNEKYRELIKDSKANETFYQNVLQRSLNNPRIAKLLINTINCPTCGSSKSFTEARNFNLMFKTFVGPLEDSSNVVYLRPETAQGIYVNFLNVKEASRQKLPFGIAQIGKAFRNEINTKNFLFRTREFEQMEMQFFIRPDEDEKWFDYWKEQRINWFIKHGIAKEKLNIHVHEKLAHYAKAAVDIEYEFPFGFGEIEGIHNRTDFDLKRHTEYSGKKIEYFDDQTKERFTPFVIETSAGASRSFMAFLLNSYDEEEVVKENSDGTKSSEVRTVLHLHPSFAPIKAAIFPLVNRDGMQDIAANITEDLRNYMRVFYDDSGAVGRRYRRQDECGTPFCITVDSDTLTDNTVTIRDRDSMVQERINKDNLVEYLLKKIK